MRREPTEAAPPLGFFKGGHFNFEERPASSYFRSECRALVEILVSHPMLTPATSITLERAMQFIKGGYSHAVGIELGRKAEVWQRGFTDHRIRDAEDFARHRNYIHENPVERKLVESASEYRYCSAFPGFKLDVWPPAAEAA